MAERPQSGELSDGFAALSERVWHAYHASTRRSFGQRMRGLWEWAKTHVSAAWVIEQVKKLSSRSKKYARAYEHPGGHRTSNMLDRVMRGMNRYFDTGQDLHGGAGGVRSARAGVGVAVQLPALARVGGGWRCSAERLNCHRYHDGWLQNLLVSASLAGDRCRIAPPP